jgi:hypothetical protein
MEGRERARLRDFRAIPAGPARLLASSLQKIEGQIQRTDYFNKIGAERIQLA